MKTLLCLPVVLACLCAQAATYYVDSSVAASGNGQSWGTAWKGISNITGLSAGDVVYFSGGPSGATRTYPVANWSPPGGAAGNPITYKIGQDAAHNGTAIFDCGGAVFIYLPKNFTVISGDAGDGQRHFALSNPSAGVIFWIGDATGVRISHINMGNVVGGSTGGETPVRMGSPRQFEFDNCYAYVTGYYCDGFAYTSVGIGGSTWDDSLFHNNVIYLPNYVTSASGPDCWQIAGVGFSIYSNTIASYATANYNTVASQHQDCFQFLWGSYIKIYANVILDMGNAVMEAGSMYGDCNHVRIYNNVCALTYPRYSSTRGFECKTYGNGYYWRDTHVFNNTFINFNYATTAPWGDSCQPVGCVNMRHTAEHQGNSVYNNLALNYRYADANTAFPLVSVVEAGNNVVINNTASLSSYFVNYFGMISNQVPNVHLTAAGNSALRTGANKYSYFTTDKDGVGRPAGGAWTLGAYEYGGANTNPVISVVPGSLSATFGLGTTNTVILQVQNTGGGTLAGTASILGASGVFTILSGQTYSLTAGQSQQVTLRCVPATTNDGAIIRFTGGGGKGVPVTNHVQLPLGLSFAATAGIITAPFSASGGYVSQAVQTGVTAGGQASYAFTITNAGNYTVSALVNAPSAAANSCYVNIDGMPTDPAMIWDVPVAAGFANRAVTWRGNGTDTSNEYNPKVFNLAAGVHQLIIIGREANVQLGQITIAPYSARPEIPLPPENPRIVTNQ